MFKIALVGNPNTGKTTLFNTLTKSNEKASNWHGVTVDVKSKKYRYKNKDFCVYDTPGVYLLDDAIAEEEITKNWLKSNQCNLVINICDANNFKRNFALTQELFNLGLDVIIAVNMSQEVCLYNYKKLSNEINYDIIEIDARKQKSIEKLKYAIYQNIHNKKLQKTTNIVKNQLNIDDFAIKENNKTPYRINDKIDKCILNNIVFILLFMTLILSMFYIVFGSVGLFISNNINAIFSKIIEKVRKIFLCVNINNVIIALLLDGILGSFITLLSFLPQILLLMFFINLLEDMGFMSRVAFMFDGLMKKIGLSGKSLFSIFMGYGCTTSAVVVSRNLENQKIRKRTVLLLPYSTCSAKLPIFLLISSLFFNKYKFLFVFLLYIFSIIIQLIYSVILNKLNRIDSGFCLFEMPKYRFPNVKKIFLDSLKTFKDFVFKTGGLLLIFGVLVWILQNFDTSLNYLNGENFSNSILYKLSSFITPIFKPLGFYSPAIVVALFFGLVAKEFLIVGLAMMNGVVGNLSLLTKSLTSVTSICYFTPTSSIVFLVFVLLYSPCFLCLSSIASEINIKTSIFVFVFQFIIAYLVTFVIKLMLENFKLFVFVLIVIILAIMLLIMIKSKCNSSCKGNCNACRKT